MKTLIIIMLSILSTSAISGQYRRRNIDLKCTVSAYKETVSIDKKQLPIVEEFYISYSDVWTKRPAPQTRAERRELKKLAKVYKSTWMLVDKHLEITSNDLDLDINAHMTSGVLDSILGVTPHRTGHIVVSVGSIDNRKLREIFTQLGDDKSVLPKSGLDSLGIHAYWIGSHDGRNLPPLVPYNEYYRTSVYPLNERDGLTHRLAFHCIEDI